MSPIIAMVIFGGGVWVFQDGVASIWHYRKTENWENHIWRVARALWGIALMVLAWMAL